jgi:transglutaminase-like putative cysteine protease
MTWRLEISHVTRFRYDRPVSASYNEARLTPMSVPGQLVIDAQVAVRPAAQLFCFTDYWGAVVHAFDVHSPHQSLLVTSRAIVETTPTGPPMDGDANTYGANTYGANTYGADAYGANASGPPASGPNASGPNLSWADLNTPEVADRFYEFLAPSRFTEPDEGLTAVADELRGSCAEPAQAVRATVDWVHSQLEYGTGATDVHTSAVDAWRAGQGVCQDFAHLSLAVLRAMRIPARYVSGYFYPDANGTIGAKVVGESHAWVEAWTGDWSGHDPTNRVTPAERHVLVARGRDYADVAPVRGIYSGPSGSSTEVMVELARRA